MNIQQAIHQFWNQFVINGKPVKAYISGQVPNNAVFPHMTYDLGFSGAIKEQSYNAFIWLQQENGTSVNELRFQFFEDVTKAVPEQGTLICFDDGYIMVYRNNDFLNVYNTGQIVNGRMIYGGKISVVMRFYKR